MSIISKFICLKKRSAYALTVAFFLILLLLIALSGQFTVHAAEQNTTSETAAEERDYTDSDPEDWITERFDVSAVATESHVFHITEEIEVNFVQPHHGIFRYIPLSPGQYKVDHIRVTDSRGNSQNCDIITKDFGKEVLIQIGESSAGLTGKNSYIISYDLICYKDFDPAADSLSLDLLPVGWDTSIREAEVTLEMPAEADPEAFNFYSGKYGNNEKGKLPEHSQLSISEDGRMIHMHVTDYPRHSGVTVTAGLPEGYWADAPEPPVTGKHLRFIAFVLTILPCIHVVMWILFGREPGIEPVPQYYPPNGITPTEMIYLLKNRLELSDFSYMLMYYADKGYLEFGEEQFGGITNYPLTKLKDIPQNEEKNFSVYLFNEFFAGSLTKDRNLEDIYRVYLKNSYFVSPDKLKKAGTMLKGHYEGENTVFTMISRVCRQIVRVMMILEYLLIAVIPCFCLDSRSCEIFSYFGGGFIFILPVGVFCLYICTKLIFEAYDRKEYPKIMPIVMRILAGSLFLFLAMWSISYLTYTFFPSWIFLLLAVSMFLSLCFGTIMPARTGNNRKLMGRILGYRNYLKDLKAVDMQYADPYFYAHNIPYAIALGLEKKYAQKYRDFHLAKPSWYNISDTAESNDLNYLWQVHICRTGNPRNWTREYKKAEDRIHKKSDSSGGGQGGFFGDGGGDFSGGGFGGGGGGAW